jgi:hypothetical protein
MRDLMMLFTILLTLVLVSTAAVAQSGAWAYSTKSSIDGHITEFATVDSNEATSLIVRCSRACEVYMTADRSIVADQSAVRVKFNDSTSLKRFSVSRGEGSDSLFFVDPMGILKAIRDNGGYMTVEYSPYGRVPTATRFGIWNLPPTILKRIEKHQAIEKIHLKKESQRYYTEAAAQSDHVRATCENDGFVWRDNGCHIK